MRSESYVCFQQKYTVLVPVKTCDYWLSEDK